MPLSAAVERQHLHTRSYEFRGFRRADKLWDIEGRIVDQKTYGFDNEERGHVAAGAPVHQMEIRLTLDDAMTVVAIEAVTDASPYRVCPEIIPNFQRVVGLKVGPGWRQAIRQRLGGAEGCTHLTELLIAMATPAYQTMAPVLARERCSAATTESWPGLLDTCHAFRRDGALAARFWPDRVTKTAKNEATG